jgi:Golgi phosphoprotein 3
VSTGEYEGTKMLHLYEELILLSLNEAKGKFHAQPSMVVDTICAAALVIELSHRGKLIVEEQCIAINDKEPTGVDLLDRAIEVISQSSKKRKPDYWIQSLPGKLKRLRQTILDSMVKQKILKKEDYWILKIFPSTKYFIREKSKKRKIIEHIRSVVLKRHEADTHTRGLLSLIQAGGLVSILFERDQQKKAKEKIKELCSERAMHKGVKNAAEAVEMAVIGSILISPVITNSINSH